MPLVTLDHFLVYANDLEASKNFYSEVLGFEVGHRPPFTFDGYWLYLGGKAVVHLATAEASAEMTDYLGERSPHSGEDTGAVDHIAFRGENFTAFKERLDTLGITYRYKLVPAFNIHQLFIKDPDGVTLELNFFEAGAA